MQVDSTKNSESLKPDLHSHPLDNDATDSSAAISAHPLATRGNMGWDSTSLLEFGHGLTQIATEELGDRTLALDFQFDTTSGRIPSWSEAVYSSASTALNSWLTDPIRYLSSQFSRSSRSNQRNGGDMLKHPPGVRQCHPTMIPMTNRTTLSTRSTKDPLRQSIGSLGISQQSIKFSSHSPGGRKVPQSISKNEEATGEIVLIQDVTAQDVLCDFISHTNHEGNKELDQKISKIREMYHDRPLTDEEREQTLSNSIVDWTHHSGGRFLKPPTGKDTNWTVMSPDEAVKAIACKIMNGSTRFSPPQVVVTPQPSSLIPSSRFVSSQSTVGSTPRRTQEIGSDLPTTKQAKVRNIPVVPETPIPIPNGVQMLSQEGELVSENNITEKDVLFGRGGKSNHHPGNKWYRQIIAQTRPIYSCDTRSKIEKTDISNAVVNYIQSHGGRFLKRGDNDRWAVMKQSDARRKAAQLLRERKALKWTKIVK